ncbi:MAG: hypothetical protein ONB48_02470 [candidate division KSB1 bacterium]|nr:hypothetical protein [candidate division KSB1 bacterium]MDZ7272458.1 hypothetical protein [candidate division KSB1 bacterium]MDZ7284518.1 hypothetical protein [candidate division KSB1 bacterium]MDZ7297086.1 hypothetical protein [candidate division KSB1 bacterium]MDZ7306126.1 hypothetical protein [candidate division KSB1 bacterium]
MFIKHSLPQAVRIAKAGMSQPAVHGTGDLIPRRLAAGILSLQFAQTPFGAHDVFPAQQPEFRKDAKPQKGHAVFRPSNEVLHAIGQQEFLIARELG